MEELLKVYHFDTDKKKRLGVNADGGYIIAELDGEYDCYISAGVSNEESFSKEFIEKYNMNKENSFAFDGTIADYPYHYTDKITYIKKNIGGHNDDNITNLSFLTDKYQNIFLKMDIEAGEYPWLLSIDETQLNKFKQIVIEFHGITGDWLWNYPDKVQCLEKIAKTHYIVHAHGNNYGCVVNNIPDVIELTLINKNYFAHTPNLNTTSMPIENLDYPNNLEWNDIKLDMYPFLYKYINNNISFSQACQDEFILNVLKYKHNGFFLEIGSSHPINTNNTYTLEKNYNWKGIMVEYDKNYEQLYKNHRPNSIHILNDATQVDYKNIFEINNMPNEMDYLQIDLDVHNRSTLSTLELLENDIFDKYKFATITFEHDIYVGNWFDTREKSRQIFNKRGYLCVFKDIHNEKPSIVFEDWYVHPDLVDMEYINKLISNNMNNYVYNSITEKSINCQNINYL